MKYSPSTMEVFIGFLGSRIERLGRLNSEPPDDAQLDPAARLPPQALSTPKALELVVTLVTVRGALPGFVAVTVSGKPEVPTYWPGKGAGSSSNLPPSTPATTAS
jgi:hypothetical protein